MDTRAARDIAKNERCILICLVLGIRGILGTRASLIFIGLELIG